MHDHTTEDEFFEDLLRRIRRIETQLFNLCLHLGIDPKNGTELRNLTSYDRNTYD